jgi:NAD(P)H-flavin reductase
LSSRVRSDDSIILSLCVTDHMMCVTNNMLLIAALLASPFTDALAPSTAGVGLRLRSTATSRWARVGPLRMGWGDDVEFKTAKVLKNEEAAKGMRSITVEAGDDILSAYTVPGQFVQIKETDDSKAGFYAIASAPGATPGVCEFLIKESEGNDWSPGNLWLCSAAAGSELIMSPAMGNGFKVDEKLGGDVTDVLLFAAGSGISPIRSAIESGKLAAKSSVTLYYGAREPALMAYMDKFGAWEDVGVKVVPVLSQGGDGWEGRAGYVQAALREDIAGLAPAKTGALMCGMKGMAEDVKTTLTEAGVDEEKILTNF